MSADDEKDIDVTDDRHLDEIDVVLTVTVRAHVEDEQDREAVAQTVEQAVRDGLAEANVTVTAVAVEDQAAGTPDEE